MVHQVFYHCPCPDGIFGALSAYLHLQVSLGEQTRFVGHTVYAGEQEIQQHLDSLHQDDSLFLIDYCGRDGFIVEAARRVRRVVLLDHHKSAAETLDELRAASSWPHNLEVVIDMNRSGATISWDYFSALNVRETLSLNCGCWAATLTYYFALAGDCEGRIEGCPRGEAQVGGG